MALVCALHPAMVEAVGRQAQHQRLLLCKLHNGPLSTQWRRIQAHFCALGWHDHDAQRQIRCLNGLCGARNGKWRLILTTWTATANKWQWMRQVKAVMASLWWYVLLVCGRRTRMQCFRCLTIDHCGCGHWQRQSNLWWAAQFLTGYHLRNWLWK